MRISVVDLSGRRDVHAVEYRENADHCSLDSVLYVSVPRRITTEELDSQLLSRIRPQWVRAAEAIVLRLHSPQSDLLLADEAVVEMLGSRFGSTPLLMAHLDMDRTVRLTELTPTSVVYDQRQLLDGVRYAELHSWLRQPGVVLPANDDFLYEGPNGYRYQSFMRVGTAIQGTEMLDAVNFWLQPYLNGEPVVLLDSWTILSVGLNLDRYAVESGAPCSGAAGVECLCGYEEDSALLEARLAALRGRTGDAPAFLVSSVVSSRQLHEKLERLVSGVGFDLSSVALYGAPASEGLVFCRPPEIASFWHPESEECPQLDVVTIEPSTYLVNVTGKPKFARLTEERAKAAWGFFERYRGIDYLSVHRQEDNERHHLIHVDVDRLTELPSFEERLEKELHQLPEIDVILSPRHRSAMDLASKVGSLIGAPRVFANEDELPGVSEEDKRLLDAARRILIVDDTLTTGTRLRVYRNFLHRCGFLSDSPPSEIHLLVGLARVDDLVLEKRIADMVDLPERFHAVETLLLPDWDDSECPWCWEQRQLDHLSSRLKPSDALERRRDALSSTAGGLRESLFIPWLDGGVESLPVSTWKLGSGSIFHVESQVELFAAVASALQRLRVAGELGEKYEFPFARVLERQAWLEARFYDPVITAAFLRATKRHDLRAFTIEPELAKGVRTRFEEKGSPDLRGELILAVARGHLPGPLNLSGELLAGGDPGFVRWLRWLLADRV